MLDPNWQSNLTAPRQSLMLHLGLWVTGVMSVNLGQWKASRRYIGSPDEYSCGDWSFYFTRAKEVMKHEM